MIPALRVNDPEGFFVERGVGSRMKYRIVGLALIVWAFSSLVADEPSAVLKKYYSFFNPEKRGKIEAYRRCFIPEERRFLVRIPAQTLDEADIFILDELKNGKTCEVRIRIRGQKKLRYFVLEERNGNWLINAALSEKRQNEYDSVSVASSAVAAKVAEEEDPAEKQDFPTENKKKVVRRNTSRPPYHSGDDFGSETKSITERLKEANRKSGRNQDSSKTSAKPVIPDGWLRGPDREWYVTYESALAAAKRQNKLIYILNTGSDWCGWCIKLNKDVLSKSDFNRIARKHFVLLYLDSPHKKPMPAAQQQYNQQIRRKLRLGGGVPTAVIMDPNGNQIGRIGGYAKAPVYLKRLKQALKSAGRK